MGLMLHEGGPIESLAIAGDALIVEASGVGRRRVRSYDLATGTLRRELLTADTMGYFGHTVVPHPDGRTLFTTYRKGFVDELDLATGERLRSIELPPLVGNGQSWPGDGGPLYVTRDAATVYVMVRGDVHAWDRATDTLHPLGGYPFASTASRLVATHDETVVWAAYHSLVRLHRESGAELRLAEPFASDIAYLAALDRLAVVHCDGTLELFTTDAPPTRTGVVPVGFDTFHDGRLVPLRGGSLVAASAADQHIAIVAPGDVAPRARLAGPWGDIQALAVEGDTLWIGDDDGRVWSEDLSGHAFATPAKKKQKLAMTVHSFASDMAGVATDAGMVSIGGVKISPPLTRDLCTWRRGERDAVAYRPFKKKLGYEWMVSLGAHVVLDDGASTFVVIDAETLKTVATLEHKKAEGLAVSPDRTRLVTTSATEMKLWSTETWKPVGGRTGEVPRKAVTWLEHEGLVVYLGPNGSFGTFSSVDLKRLKTRGFGPLESFATDARIPVVACVADGGKPGKPELALRLWNIVTDAVIELPPLRQPAFAAGGVVAIEPAGAYLAVFELDGRERKRIDLAPYVLAGSTVRLVAGGNVAAVRYEVRASREQPWSPAMREMIVDLDAGTVTPLARPSAGDVRDLVRVDGDAIVVATTAGRIEWLTSRS
jgi:WD40 repeat protein